MKYIYLIAVILFSGSIHSRTLRYVVSSSNTLPFANIENNKIVSGIHSELGQFLADELNSKVEFNVIVRQRVEESLIDGESDVLCYVRHDWVKNPDKFFWSNLLFKNSDVLAWRKDLSKPTLSGDNKLRVSTVLGYEYPFLQKILKNNFIRDDAKTMDEAFKKILLNRTDYFITDFLSLNHLRNKFDTQKKISEEVLQVELFGVYCALSKKSIFSLAEFNKAIEKISKSNKITKIVEKNYSLTNK